MKITKIETIPFRVPMREVVKFATGQLSALEHVLVRVHTDEGLVGQAEAPSRPDEIRRGTCRLMSIKNARTGYTLSKKIIALCEANGLVPVTGSQGDTEIGCYASAHFHAAHRATATGPGELSFFLDTESPLTVEPIRIRDGKFMLPDTPGLGLRIDEEKLRRYRL